jgi:phosphosulfolactate phosphohydrolase-like enzyme
LVLTTTNGTRLLLAAAARCDEVLVASLLNLDAVVSAAGEADDVAVLCAGVEGAFAIDDAYVAGRIAAALGGEPDDAAAAAVRLAGSFETPEAGIGGGISAANIRNAQLDDDIPFCARESALDVVPRVVARSATAVEIATSSRP